MKLRAPLGALSLVLASLGVLAQKKSKVGKLPCTLSLYVSFSLLSLDDGLPLADLRSVVREYPISPSYSNSSELWLSTSLAVCLSLEISGSLSPCLESFITASSMGSLSSVLVFSVCSFRGDPFQGDLEKPSQGFQTYFLNLLGGGFFGTLYCLWIDILFSFFILSYLRPWG